MKLIGTALALVSIVLAALIGALFGGSIPALQVESSAIQSSIDSTILSTPPVNQIGDARAGSIADRSIIYPINGISDGWIIEITNGAIIESGQSISINLGNEKLIRIGDGIRIDSMGRDIVIRGIENIDSSAIGRADIATPSSIRIIPAIDISQAILRAIVGMGNITIRDGIAIQSSEVISNQEKSGIVTQDIHGIDWGIDNIIPNGTDITDGARIIVIPSAPEAIGTEGISNGTPSAIDADTEGDAIGLGPVEESVSVVPTATGLGWLDGRRLAAPNIATGSVWSDGESPSRTAFWASLGCVSFSMPWTRS